MERQNEKARAALKREESGRIAKLVEDAYSQDPRVRTRLQQEKEEKERAKREAAERGRREAEERRRAEEAGAAAAEAARRAQAEEAAAKKRAKEKERDALRKARARVKALASSIGDGDGEASAQAQQALAVACAELPLSALSALSAQLEAAGGQRDQICRLIEAAAAPILKAAGIAVQPPSNGGGAENDGAAAAGGGGAAASGGSSLLLQGRREHRWTAEELALLQKGSVKFPAGIQERWARVAEFINDGTGGRAGLTEKAVTEQVGHPPLFSSPRPCGWPLRLLALPSLLTHSFRPLPLCCPPPSALQSNARDCLRPGEAAAQGGDRTCPRTRCRQGGGERSSGLEGSTDATARCHCTQRRRRSCGRAA